MASSPADGLTGTGTGPRSIPARPQDPDSNPAIPFNTPIAGGESATRANTTDNPRARAYYMDLADDIGHRIVGPMPTEDFLNLIPSNGTSAKLPPNAFKKLRDTDIKRESQIFGFLDPVISPLLNGKSMKLIDTSDTVQKMKRRSLKPDATIYPFDLKEKEYKHKITSKPYCHFGYAEMFCEFKLCDPFNDPPRDASRDTHKFILEHIKNNSDKEDAKRNIGQNVAYAIDLMRHQFRSFCFSVFIIEKRARLLRWDRAGVIISESFDYATDSDNILCEFFWRYVNAPPSVRGFDMSVTLANETQKALFIATIRAKIEQDLPFLPVPPGGVAGFLKKRLSVHYKDDHVSAVSVGNKVLLVSVPVVSPEGLVTRGTRGYWAVDEQENTVVFLKDTWRNKISAMDKEGNILEELKAKQVPNIPTVHCHGDVANDETLTHQCVEAGWACKSRYKRINTAGAIITTPRAHYRLAVKEAGYPLSDLLGTYELISATRDAHKAITVAREKAQAVHRDVSLGNIILLPDSSNNGSTSLAAVSELTTDAETMKISTVETPQSNTDMDISVTGNGPRAMGQVRKGLLVDWELCVFLDRYKGPRVPERTGTWQFMATLIMRAWVKHEVYHDIESLMWTTVFCALKWLPHSFVPPDGMRDKFQQLFNEKIKHGDAGSQGSSKQTEIMSRNVTGTIQFHSPGYTEWYRDIRKILTPGVAGDEETCRAYEWPGDTTSRTLDLWLTALDTIRASNCPMQDRVEHEISKPPLPPTTNTTTSYTSTRALTQDGMTQVTVESSV